MKRIYFLNEPHHYIQSLNKVTLDFIASYDLSGREAEIMDLVILQYSNAEIAAIKNITRNTVKFHLKNLLHKLEVTTRQEAARKALASLDSQIKAAQIRKNVN